MGDGDPTAGLWNWAVGNCIDASRVRGALAGTLARNVTELGADVPGAVLCDVYPVGGDFPTLVDIYLAPSDVDETTAASAVAVRLDAAVLLPDDTLDATRYVLAEPDGTLRAVHVDEAETDDGPRRSRVRPCTGADPACRGSRFKPSAEPGRPAAA